ncbi:DUF1127 domain-containing protein [Acuticoccus sp. M5D2P5]|uniref:DUF1127 domain-containing protein n=1 Tax=Acuticoccus kalidii TaxID=2910977 RepID=UPI001F213869|nr:DUF1127 domain-containing protein [Acuticoccus kalidii]MCF3934759.1 DUF1127 domain-containing protein [Acuticoccus kalidii]
MSLDETAKLSLVTSGPPAEADPWPRFRVLRRITRYIRFRRDYETLLELPDHLLEDVGIERAHVRCKRQDLRL